MANSKKTFLCYKEWIDYVEDMTFEEAWMLFKRILQHENWKSENKLPLELVYVRKKIEKELDENTEKRTKTVNERSKAWQNHEWNQYSKLDKKRKPNSKVQKTPLEQMEQNGTNGTNGTDSNTNTIYSSSKKEERNKKKEEMLERFRNDERLTPYMDEEYVCKRWDFKEWTKKPYKDVDSFITMLVKMKNKIKNYWGMPKSDRNRRNRFKFMVDTALEKQREWLDRYDNMEAQYENSKDDLYPNPKQNE